MARYHGMSTGLKVTMIIMMIVLVVIATICVVAGVKAGQESIGFFEALGNLFGVTAEKAPEVVEEATETTLALRLM